MPYIPGLYPCTGTTALVLALSLTLHSQTLPQPDSTPSAEVSKTAPAGNTTAPDAAREQAQKLAQTCVALAASIIKNDPTLAQDSNRLSVQKALGLARQQDPTNPQAIVMRTQLERGMVPTKADLARPLPEIATQLRGLLPLMTADAEKNPASKELKGRLLDLIVSADPADEASILALAQLETNGPTDWKAILPAAASPANPPGNPASPSTPAIAAAPGKPAAFTKSKSVIKALFVTESSSGTSTGLAGNLILTLGNGTTFSYVPSHSPPNSFSQPVSPSRPFSTSPGTVMATIGGGGTIGKNMTTALEEAVRCTTALKPAESPNAHFVFGFEEKYSPKDGGSAGTAFALLMDSFYSNYDISPDVAITGDISADGHVLKVGGIPLKIEGAVVSHARIVMIPKSNSEEVGDMVVLKSPQLLTQTQIIAIDTLSQAQKIARIDRDQDTLQNMALFDEIRGMLAKPGTSPRDPEIATKLTQLTQQMPEHVSARYLLLQSQGKLPRLLTLDGSMNALFEASGPVLPILLQAKIDKFPRLPSQQYEMANKNLNAIQFRIDPRAKTLGLELSKFLNQWQRMENFEDRDQAMWKGLVDEWLATRQRIGEECSKLTNDPEYIHKVVQGGT